MSTPHSAARRARLWLLFVIASPLAIAAETAARDDLLRAVRRNEAVTWRALLAQKAPVQAADAAGNTALHHAALNHDLAAVQALLAAGADAKAKNTRDATPLHYGAGHLAIVETLLARGADPNATSKQPIATPLMVAASHPDSFEVVSRLIAAGADVRGPASTPGQQVLRRAILAGDRRTIALLIARGAETNPKTGGSPLIDAAVRGDRETVVALLERGANPNYDNGFFGHALNGAFFGEQQEIARLLIERGADPRMVSPRGPRTPPIVWAAYNQTGDVVAARALLAAGVDVNEPDAHGATALTYALRSGDKTPLVEFLQGVGAKTPPLSRAKAIPNRPVPPTPAARAAAIRERLPLTLALLERSSAAFLENKFVQQQKCSSCHGQDLPAVAFELARVRGFAVNDHEIGRLLDARVRMWSESAERGRLMIQPLPDVAVSMGYGFIGLHALRYAADDTTDAFTHYLMRAQQAGGNWLAFDLRPPMEEGPLVATAWSTFALRHYAPAGREREAAASLARAAHWLRRQKPRTPNEAVFQLLGSGWSGEPAPRRADLARELVRAQRPDGGWAQLPGLASDAWATGSTLYALHEAGGMGVNDPVYQRGVDFLLRTQFEDGSWWVRSRSWPFQPHFNGQFPHGKDQWISQGATAWAAIALLLTFEVTPLRSPPPSPHELIARFVAAGSAHPRAEAAATGKSDAAIDFARDIQPLLERSCAGCHGNEKPRAGFTVLTRAGLLQGGASGEPAVVPGQAAASMLLQYTTDKIEDLEMPPLARRDKYPPLTAKEIALLQAWIDAGAPESSAPAGAKLTRTARE